MIVPLLENILSNFEIFQYTKEIWVVRVLILPVHDKDGCFLPILDAFLFLAASNILRPVDIV